MATDVKTIRSEQDLTIEEKLEHMRELFADAPEVGKAALESVLEELTAQATQTPPPPVESAGRAGIRLGNVSELTIIVPLAPGGAGDARVPAAARRQPRRRRQGWQRPQHALRLLDNDTRMLFATAFDGEWDTYIDDFATKIPDYLDIINSAWEGSPGIRSPEAKDYLLKYQVTAEGWYVSSPDLTVAETRRLQRIGATVDEFLDKVGD